MKPFRWDPDKNERLKAGRGISFEEIIAAVEEDGLKDILVHPNQRRYPGQVVLVVAYRDYILLVPSVEEKSYSEDRYPKPEGDARLSGNRRER